MVGLAASYVAAVFYLPPLLPRGGRLKGGPPKGVWYKRVGVISGDIPGGWPGVLHAAAVAVTSMVAAVVMRTFVLATMLASASSFAPAPKTQLAMRRPPPTPPRVMPPVMIPHSPLHCVGFPGFPSQASKNWEIAMVCLVPTPHGPTCTSPLDSRAPEATALAPGASLEPLASGACPCHVRRHQHNQLPAPPLPRLRRRRNGARESDTCPFACSPALRLPPLYSQ